MRPVVAALAALLAVAPAGVPGQARPGAWVDAVLPVARPAEPGPVVAIPVTLPRANPAREAWAQQTRDQRLAYNIAAPQLVRYPSALPDDRVAPAVLVVPGGGFQFLAMDNEGYDVARRLDRLGLRVFIVKYRTLPLPDRFDGFKAALAALFQRGERPASDNRPFAVADTQSALRLVRAQAAEWRVDPARIGMIGFSAGAVTALGAAQANAVDARADFLALIYGPTELAAVPPNAPPMFAAIAADDRFFRAQDLGLIHAWRRSGASVELHLYSGGGHGFASQPNGTTSDAWFDQFGLWLRVGGIIAAR